MATPRVSEYLHDLADAADAYALEVQTQTGGPIGLGTEGSSEIAADGWLRWGHETEPVHTAHSAVRLGHFYVLDAYHSLARLTVTEPPSIYGPFVLGRSLLDTAGWVFWLAEPAIGPNKRIQRRLVLDLAERNAQNIPDRPELKPAIEQIEKDRKEAEAFCAHHGWVFQPGGQKQPPLLIGAESKPTAKQLIDEVLGVDLEEISKGLGATLWWFLSGFTHGAMGGILYAVERNPSTDPTQGTAAFYVKADAFTWLLVACGHAAIETTRRRTELLGDGAPSILEKQEALEAQFVRYLTAVAQGRLP